MAHPKPASPNEPKTADVPAAAKSAPAEIRPAEGPTYFAVRSSSAYTTARRLLNAGQFEDALALIEASMVATRQSLGGAGRDGAEEADELHPSLAPLHYLYGTTLLYSVEESDDMVNSAAASAQGAGTGPNEEMTEDLEIAWENLDLARTIMETRGLVGPAQLELASKGADASDAIANARTVVLDLAQIHLRLADLQKANGAYRDCIADYAKALELRTAVLGPYDRKVADGHYQLGVVCMTRAAEGDKADGGDGNGDSTAAAAAAASTGLLPAGAEDGILGMMSAAAAEAAAEADKETKPSPEECYQLRQRSVAHYLACAKSFGGCIAKLCGVEDETKIEELVGKIEVVATGADPAKGEEGDKKMPAVDDEEKKVGSTDSVDGDEKKREHQAYAAASKTLADLRAKCAELASAKKPAVSSSADASSEDNEEVVADLLSLLDELQETIDSQEEDLAGALQEVHAMKAKIEEEIRAADADPFGGSTSAAAGADGGVTTIGFGAPSSAAGAAVATSATAAAAGTGEPARPMMVVKKKKKRAALATPAPAAEGAAPVPVAEASDDAKPDAAAAEPDAKRAKTE